MLKETPHLLRFTHVSNPDVSATAELVGIFQLSGEWTTIAW
jgi:hypothetical protein